MADKTRKMASLIDKLGDSSAAWAAKNYIHPDYNALDEIFSWARDPDGAGFRLRPPQLRALEVYWYLRLIEGTPRTIDIYEKFFPSDDDPDALVSALGIPQTAFKASKYRFSLLWQKVRDDDEFVREHGLQALRETLLLRYPSYILALAMGAGKTALIGAIIATEFAMALEYPEGPFIQNALVFAPGTTILSALRQLATTPFERILPPRLFKDFAASVRLIFTRDGERDIPVIRGSLFNVVVTNTEKIRIQKESILKRDLGSLLLNKDKEDDARAEVANLRLQAVASLPHLGIFSDEAHHTYGQALDAELKKVRKTVDYLHENSPNLICVINTTGTPYFKRQALRDVVIWYGLSQGIADNILKSVGSNIYAYNFDGNARAVIGEIIGDFFKKYRDVSLPDGSAAKLAIYFPQTDDLHELRPAVEAKLMELGLDPSMVLERHSDSSAAERDAFERLNDPKASQRVILLVNMGTEGWNVPSLFACALARKLKTSNNFVLQTASRCLRQVPGNNVPASIYLSTENQQTLDRELRETYGESLQDLRLRQSDNRTAKIRVLKVQIPPIVITQLIRRVIRKEGTDRQKISFIRPNQTSMSKLERVSFVMARQAATKAILRQVGDALIIDTPPETMDAYFAATELAASYRLDVWEVYEALRAAYGGDDIPFGEIDALSSQIEEKVSQYEIREERIERALALIKLAGFDHTVGADGIDAYTAEIRYPVDREKLLAHFESWQSRNAGTSATFGFHYSPYNFDSNPELSFFETIFEHAGLHADEVEDIFFTGAITDPRKSDFFVEYLGEDSRWHRYTPDFVIRRKDGRCLIIEIKAERDRSNPVNGEAGSKALAVRRWQELNTDRIRYQMIFVRDDVLSRDDGALARKFIED